MTFHIKVNIAFGRICSIAIGILFLIFLGVFIRSYDDLILYGIFTVIPEIWFLVSSKKETVITVVNKTITVTDVYKYKKNKSISFSYGEIRMISVTKKRSVVGYSISLRSGTNVKLACANDKKLDNFINDLITVLRVADPQFDADYRKQETAQKEEQKRNYILMLKIFACSILLGYAASFLGCLTGITNTDKALCYGFFIGIAFFLIFAVIRRRNLKKDDN